MSSRLCERPRETPARRPEEPFPGRRRGTTTSILSFRFRGAAAARPTCRPCPMVYGFRDWVALVLRTSPINLSGADSEALSAPQFPD